MTTTLTMGPVLFNWSANILRDFYAQIADEAPVDFVCVGEVVCSKRLPFFEHDLPDIIERLERGGKTVIVSSLAMPTLTRERRQIATDSRSDGRLYEANDVSALTGLAGQPHAIGPFINVYNEATLAHLVSSGAKRICLPPELPLASVKTLAAHANGAAIEVFAFGRVPLAISARCYHARILGLSKDSCQFVCAEDGDGRTVETLDHEPFLAINGVQTMSYTYANFVADIPDIVSAGVTGLRLSPHTADMVAVSRIFRETLDGQRDADAAIAALRDIVPNATFSNGFLHGVEGSHLSQVS